LFNKKALTIFTVIIGSLLIFGLSRNIIRLLKAEKKVDQVQNELKEAQSEHSLLLKKFDYFESEVFIEEQARNKLNMAKEGESVVILPPDFKPQERKDDFQLPHDSPNWKRWLVTFGFLDG